jgi:hypothetical protein
MGMIAQEKTRTLTESVVRATRFQQAGFVALL